MGITSLGPMTRFERALNAAFDRHKAWELTEAEYNWLASMPCDYCAAPTGAWIGLDRLDNRKGYMLACLTAHVMRHSVLNRNNRCSN